MLRSKSGIVLLVTLLGTGGASSALAGPAQETERAATHAKAIDPSVVTQAPSRSTSRAVHASTTRAKRVARGPYRNAHDDCDDRTHAPSEKGTAGARRHRLLERVQPRRRSRAGHQPDPKRHFQHGSLTHVLSAAAASHEHLWQLRERQWQGASLRRAQYQAARTRTVRPFDHRDTTLLRTQKSAARAVAVERRAARKLKYDV